MVPAPMKVERDMPGVTAADELATLDDLLQAAKPHNLELEVIWSSLKIVKANPDLTMAQVAEMAKAEWDL